MVSIAIDRLCATGIQNFDEFLGGGIPRGSVVLLVGKPGTGKTTFALSFLYHGAKHGEKGVFISLLKPKKSIYDMARAYGMNFEELESKGLLEFIEFAPQLRSEFSEMFLLSLIASLKSKGISRLVIDSLSPLLWFLSSSKSRAIFYSTLYRSLHDLGATTLITVNEEPNDPSLSELEYIVDGVIYFYTKKVGHRTHRMLSVPKMRGVRALPYDLPFAITKRGLRVLIPPIQQSKAIVDYSQLLDLVSPTLKEVIGPVPRGSQILVLTDYNVRPSPLLMLYVLYVMVLNKLKTLLITFSRPYTLDAIMLTLKNFAPTPSINVKEIERYLEIRYIDPTMYSLPEIVAMAWEFAEETKADLVVSHGERLLLELHREEEPIRYMVMWASMLKAKKITTLRNIMARPDEYIPIAEFSDIVLRVEGTSPGECVIKVLKTSAGKVGSEIPCSLPMYELIETRGKPHISKEKAESFTFTIPRGSPYS